MTPPPPGQSRQRPGAAHPAAVICQVTPAASYPSAHLTD